MSDQQQQPIIEKEKEKEKEKPLEKKKRVKAERNKTDPLKSSYILDIAKPWLPHGVDENWLEIGIDEAGRGPLFGPVFVAAVILPTASSGLFDHSKMKDSKRFSSDKKIVEAADYIKKNALAWSVQCISEKTIDEMNILQATYQGMRQAIQDVMNHLKRLSTDVLDTPEIHDVMLLVDGNSFPGFTLPQDYYPTGSTVNEGRNLELPFVCIEGGDNKYTAIAAASILAKVERDAYILKLCEENPFLSDHYSIHTNKGYGSAKHMEGIKKHGVTQWHRMTFAPCSSCL